MSAGLKVLAVTLLIIVGSVTAGAATPAGAHASLVGSNPKDGASLTTAPTVVTLRYDENVRDPSVVIVKGPDGKRVDTGGTTVLDNKASVKVDVRQAGEYTVAFRVISADGHPVSDTLDFSFHGKDATAPAPGSGSDSSQPQTGSRTGLVVGGAAVLVLVVAGGLMFGRRRGASATPGGGSR